MAHVDVAFDYCLTRLQGTFSKRDLFEHIDDRYSQEAYALGRTFPDGTTRRMMTTRKDGTITISVNNEGKYSLSTQCLIDNKTEKVTNDLSWLFEAVKNRR